MHHEHGHAAWACSTDMQHRKVAWTSSVVIEHGDTEDRTCIIDMHGAGHGRAAWTCSCSMDRDMQHGNGREAWAETAETVKFVFEMETKIWKRNVKKSLTRNEKIT
jgi:hypothetical protein